MTQESIFAGIDVAKDRLYLALRPSGTVRTVACDAAGIRALVSELRSLRGCFQRFGNRTTSRDGTETIPHRFD